MIARCHLCDADSNVRCARCRNGVCTGHIAAHAHLAGRSGSVICVRCAPSRRGPLYWGTAAVAASAGVGGAIAGGVVAVAAGAAAATALLTIRQLFRPAADRPDDAERELVENVAPVPLREFPVGGVAAVMGHARAAAGEASRVAPLSGRACIGWLVRVRWEGAAPRRLVADLPDFDVADDGARATIAVEGARLLLAVTRRLDVELDAHEASRSPERALLERHAELPYPARRAQLTEHAVIEDEPLIVVGCAQRLGDRPAEHAGYREGATELGFAATPTFPLVLCTDDLQLSGYRTRWRAWFAARRR